MVTKVRQFHESSPLELLAAPGDSWRLLAVFLAALWLLVLADPGGSWWLPGGTWLLLAPWWLLAVPTSC